MNFSDLQSDLGDNNLLKDHIKERKMARMASERQLLRIRRLTNTSYAVGPTLVGVMDDLEAVADGGGKAWASMSLLGSQLSAFINARTEQWLLSQKAVGMTDAMFAQMRKDDVRNSEREPVLSWLVNNIEAYEAVRATATLPEYSWEAYVDPEDTEVLSSGWTSKDDLKGRDAFSLERWIREFSQPREPKQDQLMMFAARRKISFDQALKLAEKARGNQAVAQRRDYLAEALIVEFRGAILKRYNHLPDELPGWLGARLLGKLSEHCDKRLQSIDNRILMGNAFESDNGDACVYENAIKTCNTELRRLQVDVQVDSEVEEGLH